MIDQVLTAIFGSKHERDVKRMLPIVSQINALEPEISRLSDDGLRAKTQVFRDRLKPAVEAVDQALKEIPRDDVVVKTAKADLQAALDRAALPGRNRRLHRGRTCTVGPSPRPRR